MLDFQSILKGTQLTSLDSEKVARDLGVSCEPEPDYITSLGSEKYVFG